MRVMFSAHFTKSARHQVAGHSDSSGNACNSKDTYESLALFLWCNYLAVFILYISLHG